MFIQKRNYIDSLYKFCYKEAKEVVYMKIIENNSDDYFVCEYNALKSELNTRLSLISNKASTAIVSIFK